MEEVDLCSVWSGPQQGGCGYKAGRHLTQGGSDSFLEEGSLSELKGEGAIVDSENAGRENMFRAERAVCAKIQK